MKIVMFTDHPQVMEGAKLLMKHYNAYKFLEKVRAVNSFSDRSSANEVARRLQESTLLLEIVPYKPFNPWSKVLADSFKVKAGWRIRINMRKADLAPVERGGNLMHEFLHGLGYSHKSATDYESVPYKVGYMFTEYLKDLHE